jgi:enediyne biosynthesis thioesterase
MRHVVGFAETNVVGNVYYTHYLAWQGRCRELFLRDHAPTVLLDLQRDVRFVTTRCACEYFAEVFALDELSIRMRLVEMVGNRMLLAFDYLRVARNATAERGAPGGEELVARGEQEIACQRRSGEGWGAAPFPEALRSALAPFGSA